MNLGRLGREFWNLVEMDVKASFLNIEGRRWYKYTNKSKKEKIRNYIESKSKFCYDSSTEAILHFKNR